VLFETYGDGLKTAQVLLTAQDLKARETYLNVRNTISTLFAFGTIIPIVNENDSTAPSESRFGDNDTLAARIAAKIDAQLLIILSDVDGLYDRHPSEASAKLIEQVDDITDELEAMAGDTAKQTSTGGMRTKLLAAKIARRAGVTTALANGRSPNIIHNILSGTARCTIFRPVPESISHRKRWIAFGRSVSGYLQIDDGARTALIERGRSLLAAGIVEVRGQFDLGSVVSITDLRGRDVARGVVNYSSEELLRIKGHRSGEIERILGTKYNDEVIHRDNLVILSEK
jgi:glutamate 5-kinase